MGFPGRLAVATGFAAGFPPGFAAGLPAGGGDADGGLAVVCANADKLARFDAAKDATRTLVKANTRAEFEKRMALWR